jgi:hypothetical protein
MDAVASAATGHTAVAGGGCRAHRQLSRCCQHRLDAADRTEPVGTSASVLGCIKCATRAVEPVMPCHVSRWDKREKGRCKTMTLCRKNRWLATEFGEPQALTQLHRIQSKSVRTILTWRRRCPVDTRLQSLGYSSGQEGMALGPPGGTRWARCWVGCSTLRRLPQVHVYPGTHMHGRVQQRTCFYLDKVVMLDSGYIKQAAGQYLWAVVLSAACTCLGIGRR